MIQAALCLVLFGVADLLLKYIPTALVWAFFAFMALESLPGNQLWDRLQIIVSEPKRRIQWLQGRHCLYLETVKFPSIVIFTLIQFGCVLVIWAITVWTGLFGISFPLWIMALVPLRAFLLPKILRPEYLSDLDAWEITDVGDGADGEGRSKSVGMWFPEDQDEDSAFAREFGEYFMTSRHLISRSQLQARLKKRQGEDQLQRRHSIDIPELNWREAHGSDMEAREDLE